MRTFVFPTAWLLGAIVAQATGAELCNVPGSCVGVTVGTIAGVSTPDNCLGHCKNTTDCNWYTSNPDIDSCTLYSNCTINIDDCPNCISGEATCPFLECNMKGQCQGTLLHLELTTSHTVCQEDCAANVDCSYYSFDYESQLCHQYANCPDQSTEFCPRCISGQPGCGVDQYLMVIGGYDGSYLDEVELVSLRADMPVPPCLQNLRPMPSARGYAAGGPLQPGGTPHICGGFSTDQLTDCLRYNFGLDAWTSVSEMQYISEGAAYAHDDRLGLVMAGGVDADGQLINNVQRTFDGLYFEDLADAPTIGFFGGCMSIFDSSKLYVASGWLIDRLHEYNMATSTWTSLGLMPSGVRGFAGCGVAKNRLNQMEVIISGGTMIGDDVAVDIFNLETREWKTSDNSLPIPMYGMASVPYGDTFLLVGGYREDTGDYLDTIYIFQPFGETFSLVPGARLQTGRIYHTAFFVDAMSFPECT